MRLDQQSPSGHGAVHHSLGTVRRMQISSVANAAKMFSTNHRSIFFGLQKNDVENILNTWGKAIPTPSYAEMNEITRLGAPDERRACGTFEGCHLQRERDPFTAIYMPEDGAIIRYSEMKTPDLYSDSLQSHTRAGLILDPWDSSSGRVSLSFLTSRTRLFDTTYECEAVGVTELLTKRETWLTGVYRSCSAAVWRIETDFFTDLEPKLRLIVCENAARIMVDQWAKRCRRQQELLNCAATGRDPNASEDGREHTERAKLQRHLALLHLDLVSRRMIERYPTAKSLTEKRRYLMIRGNYERLAYHVGVRPPGFRTTWAHLCGMRRVTEPKPDGTRGYRSITVDAVIEKSLSENYEYAVDLDQLQTELMESKFSVDIEYELENRAGSLMVDPVTRTRVDRLKSQEYS